MNTMLRKSNGQYQMPLYKAIGIALTFAFVLYTFIR